MKRKEGLKGENTHTEKRELKRGLFFKWLVLFEKSCWLFCLVAQVRCEVEGELTNDSVVVLLNLAEHLDVALGDEVDGDTLAAEAATAANSVEVVLHVGREVVVDNDVHVVDVDTAGNEIGGDEDAGVAVAEVVHDLLTLALGHVGVDGGDGVVGLVELLGHVVDLSAGVDEDDGLGNGDGLVEVHEGLELVVLLDGDVELLDAIQGEGLLADEDAGRVAHELLGELEDVAGHGGGEEAHLDVAGHEAEDLVDLLLEALGEHLVGLVEDHELHHVGAEGTTLHDVEDTAGGADGDDGAALDLLDVVLDAGAADEGLAELVVGLGEVVADAGEDLVGLDGEFAGGGEDEGLERLLAEVEAGEETNGEGSGLACSGLSLSDDVALVDEGDDGALLDSRGFLEAIRVDSAKEELMEGHVVERGEALDVRGVVDEGVVVVGLVLSSGGRMWGGRFSGLGHFCVGCKFLKSLRSVLFKRAVYNKVQKL